MSFRCGWVFFLGRAFFPAVARLWSGSLRVRAQSAAVFVRSLLGLQRGSLTVRGQSAPLFGGVVAPLSWRGRAFFLALSYLFGMMAFRV